MPSPTDLHTRALHHARAGRLTQARSLFERACTLSDDPDLTARCELSLAYIDAETGNPGAGLPHCRELLERPGLSRETYGLIWSQLGLLDQRTGDADVALDDFSHAIPLLDDSPEHLGRALLNRGRSVSPTGCGSPRLSATSPQAL